MPAHRIESIQWLRGLAAVLVLVVHGVMTITEGHLPVTHPFVASIPNLATFGASGVDLFFVISGFAMAQSLSFSNTGAATFLRARWLRIVPLFVMVSMIYLMLLAKPLSIQAILMSVTILPVFDGAGYHPPALYVGWTLGFEFAFYALVAVAALARRARIATLLALTMAAASLGLVVHPGWAPLRLLFNPLQAEFALGIGVWLVWHRGWAKRMAAPALVTGIALLAIGLMIGLGLPFTAHYAAAVDGSSGIARTWTWGLPWALIVLGLLGEHGRGIIAGVFRHLGDASYSIYLAHPCVLVIVRRLHPDLGPVDPVLYVAALVALSIGAGLLVHAALERPLLALFTSPAKARAPFRNVNWHMQG